MELTWKPLQVSGTPAPCPPLFAKTKFTSNSYVVFLTDLRNIWKESMDRKSIFKRALCDETAIDPTEDAAQMRLLLDHIRNAIEGHAGTRRQVTKNVKDSRALNLHLTAPLPGSLGSLEWMLNFTPLPSASLQHHVISPLMSNLYHHMQQVDDLVGRLNAKDHVISKLLDKLEASGTDITTIFPGAAGAVHLTPREQAVRQVQGLGPFDSEHWRQSYAKAQNARVPESSLFRVLEVSASTKSVDDDQDQDDLWLSSLPTAVSNVVDEVGNPSTGGDALGVEKTPITEEDEFERQATPPRLKKSREPQNSSKLDLSSSLPRPAYVYDSEATTDDEDLDGPPGVHKATSLSAPSTSTPPVTSPEPKKLGRLGGRASKPPEKPPAGSGKAAEGETTASETEDEDDTDIATVPDPEPEPAAAVQAGPSGREKSTAAPTRRGKLGVLGGKKSPSKANGSASSTPPPSTASVSSGIHSRISGDNEDVGSTGTSMVRRARSPDVSLPRVTSEGRTTSTPYQSIAPESELDRANRKREELKRSLEKSQGPKKKRKF